MADDYSRLASEVLEVLVEKYYPNSNLGLVDSNESGCSLAVETDLVKVEWEVDDHGQINVETVAQEIYMQLVKR